MTIFRKKNIPNILTSFRILLIPVFLYFLFSDFNHAKTISFLIFILASTTDALDGFYARKYNLISRFGIFFDPIADKLLVLSAFYSFMFIPALSEEVKLWMIFLISFRDILVTILRMIMEYKGITMVTSKIGKLKTILQMTTIILVLLYLILFSHDISFWRFINDKSILYFSMLVTTLVTFYTGLHYFYYNHKFLQNFFFKR